MKKEKCNCNCSVEKNVFSEIKTSISSDAKKVGMFPETPILCEPKRVHRYAVCFPEELRIESFAVQKLSLPSEFNGKWENISMEFLDLIGPSISLNLFKFIKEQNTIFNKIKRFFLKNNILFSFKIELFDPTGCAIEEWFVDVKKIAHISYGEVDYSKDGLLKIAVDFEIKNCNLISATWK